MAAIQAVSAAGYCTFSIFDNCGDFVLTTGDTAVFADLNVFLRQMRSRRGPIVDYFDVCAFSERDRDLQSQLRSWVADERFSVLA